MKEILSAAIGGTVVAVITNAAGYYVNYLKIERPKLALEANKAAAALVPKAAIGCNAEAVAKESWVVSCLVSNDGFQQMNISLPKLKIQSNSLDGPIEVNAADHYAVTVTPNESNSPISPNSKKIVRAFIKPTQNKTPYFWGIYPKATLEVTFEVFTPRSVRYFLAEAYPEAENDLMKLSSSIMTQTVQLHQYVQSNSQNGPVPLTGSVLREVLNNIK